MRGTAHPVCGTDGSQRSYGWDPSVVCWMWWGLVGPSAPVGGTAHPVWVLQY